MRAALEWSARIVVSASVLWLGAAGCNKSIVDPNMPPGMPALSDPGRVTIHRLNRVEYNNTVADLLGTRLRPADDFPSDDRGYGFDNIADVLSLSPLQVELYNHAAEALATEAVTLPLAKPFIFHFEAAQVKSNVGAAFGMDAWNLYSNGDLTSTVQVPAEGEGRYAIDVRCFGMQAGPEPVKMAITVDGVVAKQFDVPAVQAAPMVYTVETMLKKGLHTVTVSFLNDYYLPPDDRNLVVYWWEVRGPLDLPPPKNPIRDRIFICDPAKAGNEPCAREMLARFGKRAFRRPLADDELARLTAFVPQAITAGDTFDTGIQLAIEAMLSSPHFLFRVETDAAPDDPMAAHALGAYELASRISYFLWSSMPDDALLAAADDGTLDTNEGIRAQVIRMLADPRSEALVQNFAGQWLYTRAVDDHVPFAETFPDWDDDLKEAMRAESQQLFRELLQKDLSVDSLLTADYTWADARLAKHYGLTFDRALGETQRLSLAATSRRGILGHGSVLMSTSYPGRTSPVKRGKWVLEQLLCSGPMPPPPGVEGLKTEMVPTGSLRQRLEAHRKDEKCAVCHVTMDDIGFALENYDGIGAWRTMDAGFPIDAQGNGAALGLGSFNGAGELSAALVKSPLYTQCVTLQLFTYALGRAPEYADGDRLNTMSAAFRNAGGKLKELIALIVTDDAFRRRRGEAPAGGMP